jgi:hypothetical protein
MLEGYTAEEISVSLNLDIEHVKSLLAEIKKSIKERDKASEELALEMELELLTLIQKQYLHGYHMSLSDSPAGDPRFINGALETAKTRQKLLGLDSSKAPSSITVFIQEKQVLSKHGMGEDDEN